MGSPSGLPAAHEEHTSGQQHLQQRADMDLRPQGPIARPRRPACPGRARSQHDHEPDAPAQHVQ